MRKEQFLAIILGGFIGVFVAFGVWQYFKTMGQRSTSDYAKGDNISEVNEPQIKQELSLLKPLPNSVYTNSEIEISGLSNSSALLAIIHGNNSTLSNSNQKGEFDEMVELEAGLSKVSVYSLSAGKKSIENANVVYSPLVESEQNLKLMLGTVTDISEKTIQIKTSEDIIEQISVNNETTFATNVTKAEEIEFSEVALGDYIAAIGSTSAENSVFEANRIIVTSLPEDSELKVVYGKVKALSAKEFIVNDYIDGEFSVDATGKVNVTKFDEESNFVKARLAEADEGQEIVIIGEFTEDELIASRIHIFPTSL